MNKQNDEQRGHSMPAFFLKVGHENFGLALILLLMCGIVGCGKKVKRFDISGNVTFDGEPVKQGSIIFTPDKSKGNTGPAAFVKIIDGKYDTATQGIGLIGGAHRITIKGFDGNATAENPIGAPLFDRYETDFDFPSEDTTKDFDVPIQ